MRVVVTGGSGKLGVAVVAGTRRPRLRRGQTWTGCPRGDPKCPYTYADLTDYGQVVEVMCGIDSRYDQVDAVVHLAAIPGPGVATNAATFANNITTTYNVFHAARAAGISNIVWASSETLLGSAVRVGHHPPYFPVDEEYPARPETSYALAKHLEEQMAAQLCRQDPRLKMIGLRFSNVMTPDDYAAFPSFNDDPRLRSWNAVVLHRPPGRRAGGPQGARTRRRRHGRLHHRQRRQRDDDTGRRTRRRGLSRSVEFRRPVQPHETLLSIEKARRVLGYEPQFGWRNPR